MRLGGVSGKSPWERRIGLIRRQECPTATFDLTDACFRAAKSLRVSGRRCTIVQAEGRKRKFPFICKSPAKRDFFSSLLKPGCGAVSELDQLDAGRPRNPMARIRRAEPGTLCRPWAPLFSRAADERPDGRDTLRGGGPMGPTLFLGLHSPIRRIVFTVRLFPPSHASCGWNLPPGTSSPRTGR